MSLKKNYQTNFLKNTCEKDIDTLMVKKAGLMSTKLSLKLNNARNKDLTYIKNMFCKQLTNNVLPNHHTINNAHSFIYTTG